MPTLDDVKLPPYDRGHAKPIREYIPAESEPQIHPQQKSLFEKAFCCLWIDSNIFLLSQYF